MRILLIACLALLLPYSVLATTPTVSNVTGTITTGATLTITGTTMVDEDQSDWDSFFTSHTDASGFEGASRTADGYSQPSGKDKYPEYVTDVKIIGNQSVYYYNIGTGGSCPTANDENYMYFNPEGGDANDFWVRFYVRYEAVSSWPTSHIKLIDVQGSGSQYYFQPEDEVPTHFKAVVGGGATTQATIPSGPLEDFRWYTIEIHWRTASSPYIFDVWIDGEQVLDLNPSSQGSMNYVLIGLINSCGGSYSVRTWMDGLGVKHSGRIYPASTIEVGDSATYGLGNEQFQQPLALGEVSSQIKLDLDSLGGGPYYLWVTNNKQERSSGYLLGSGSGDTTPPNVTATNIPNQSPGTTSVTPSLIATDNVAVTACKWAETDIVYGSMSNTMTNTAGDTWTADSDLSVSDDNSYILYYGCTDAANNLGYDSDGFSVASGTGIPTKDTQLFLESFEDNSWASRGWYDGTNATGSTAGGYSGNGLKWTWTSSGLTPTDFVTIRKPFIAQDEFLIDYYVKFESGWQGSGQNYHPHFLMVQSIFDSDYQSLAQSNSNLYFESSSNTGAPYTNYPVTAHQDWARVNTSNGTPPNDLTAVTEDRSANYCNTPYALSGADGGDCYSAGASYYSANRWSPDTVAIPENQWVHMIAYVKINTYVDNVGQHDGVMKLWVDEVVAIDSSTVLYAANNFSTTKWDKVILGPWIGDGSPITQTMWIDELSIWTVTTPPPVIVPNTLTCPGNYHFQ